MFAKVSLLRPKLQTGGDNRDRKWGYPFTSNHATHPERHNVSQPPTPSKMTPLPSSSLHDLTHPSWGQSKSSLPLPSRKDLQEPIKSPHASSSYDLTAAHSPVQRATPSIDQTTTRPSRDIDEQKLPDPIIWSNVEQQPDKTPKTATIELRPNESPALPVLGRSRSPSIASVSPHARANEPRGDQTSLLSGSSLGQTGSVSQHEGGLTIVLGQSGVGRSSLTLPVDVFPSGKPYSEPARVKNEGSISSVGQGDLILTKEARLRAEPDGMRYSEEEAVIAVMGVTGAGKSSFIDQATQGSGEGIGHSLKSRTTGIVTTRTKHPKTGKSILFVDTPGFDGTNLSDTEILEMIAKWLEETYHRKIKLAGIFYLHPISDNRMAGTALKNLRNMSELCGEDALHKVILLMTFWDEVDQEVGPRRESALVKTFWRHVVRNQNQVARFYQTFESAWAAVDLILSSTVANDRSSIGHSTHADEMSLYTQSTRLSTHREETHSAIPLGYSPMRPVLDMPSRDIGAPKHSGDVVVTDNKPLHYAQSTGLLPKEPVENDRELLGIQDGSTLLIDLEKQLAQHEIAVKYLSKQREIIKELEQDVAGLETNIKANAKQLQSLKVPLPRHLQRIINTP